MSSTITSTDFLKTTINAAEHYGFNALDELKQDKSCKQCEQRLQNNASAMDRRIDAVFGLLTGGVNAYCDAKLNGLGGPVMFYTVEQVPRTGEPALALHIFNVERSIAEAILIHTAQALMRDLGFADTYVRINSLGDSDSSTRYTRELSNFLKKRLDLMSPIARELMKEHPIVALMHLIEKEDELALKTPNPLEYLSDQSRRHFRELIEYLDMSATSYEIDPKMIGHHDCYSEALFAVDIASENPNEPSPVTVQGGRYDRFLQKRAKIRGHAASVVFVLNNASAPQRAPRVRLEKPQTYVVQLGFGPKVRSLMVIDMLRKAGIRVLQDLPNDSLSAQLRKAEATSVKHTIIIGQKEFVDNTVILRDMEARNQEHVPLDQLVRKLKRAYNKIEV